MYPPLLMLQQSLSSNCLEYRRLRLPGAEFTANTSSRNGLSGSARFPWESAFSGIELQGTQWGTYEVHINADIALALCQFYWMTHNETWLRPYYPILEGICTFWADWATLNKETQLYEFDAVMGPDEYYYPVQNSAYTNFAAQQTLSFCTEAAELLNATYPATWTVIAESTYIPFDAANAYHPESDDYKRGQTVKQADTIMLYFPWMFNEMQHGNDSKLRQIQTNDLLYYAQVTDPKGPAMTWAMFVVGWLSLNENTRAQTYFDRSFITIQCLDRDCDGRRGSQLHHGCGRISAAVYLWISGHQNP